MSSQTAHPWRAVVRTVIQMIVGFCAMFPLMIDASGAAQTGLIAAALAISGAVTRIMALPQVNEWLEQFILTSWLAAEPPVKTTD